MIAIVVHKVPEGLAIGVAALADPAAPVGGVATGGLLVGFALRRVLDGALG